MTSQPLKVGDVLYRCEYIEVYSSFYYDEFRVVKVTRCGAWIDVGLNKKFVLNDSRKRYAYPTKQEALESFLARKKRYVRILKLQLERAIRMRDAAQELINRGPDSGPKLSQPKEN